MADKEFQIKNIYLKESSFKFQGEEIFHTDKEKFNQLKYQISLKEIRYNKISEDDYLSNLGLVVQGIIPNDNGENETIFEVGCLYSCLAKIKGFTEEEIFKIQHINLSQGLYPYIRSEVNRIMSDSIIPKIQLQFVDFAGMYFNKFENEKKEESND
tara:strand:- start:1124 stop:1591 length:468 start_codon:yes stop_codon:yes gene_type:complete